MSDVVIVSQGDELTTGAVADTNAAFIAGRLWDLGLTVRRVMTAPDDRAEITAVLAEAARLAPVVICTGGLGPTRDDLTAEAAAAAFGRALHEDAGALAQVEAAFVSRGRPMNPTNRKQAVLPEGAVVLENRWGTAPGFRVDHAGTALFFLPGVPREMRPMMETWVLPAVRALRPGAGPRLRVLRVLGVPESELEARLQGMGQAGLTVGFRTRAPENEVKLRFDAAVSAESEAAAVAEARGRIGSRAWGLDCGDLAEVVAAALTARGETLGLAESCTAGRLAAWLGSVPGASAFLLEGAVVYSNDAKVRTCGVAPAQLEAHGAVSEPVARALAEGIRARAGSTYGIGITGIAGPAGGTAEKPVGTVHLALAGPGGTLHRAERFFGDRDRVTASAAAAALFLLLRSLRGGGGD
jgi:nicotinamide-nucleotide amidase